MMVEVWNDNTHDFKQTWREREIFIKAKSFIKMELDDAKIFEGVYYPVMKNADGQQDPKSYKMLRIVMPGQKSGVELSSTPKAAEHLCQACSYVGQNAADLDDHITAMHLEAMLETSEKDKRKAK